MFIACRIPREGGRGDRYGTGGTATTGYAVIMLAGK